MANQTEQVKTEEVIIEETKTENKKKLTEEDKKLLKSILKELYKLRKFIRKHI